MLTRSQAHVFEQLVLMGETFFRQDFAGLTIRPRLFPLVVGPTVAGKTFLVQRVAQRLGATHFRITWGDWIPRGARDGSGSQTTFAILEALEQTEALLLHLDELDKCREDFQNAWSRSVANDLWNVMDGLLPVADYWKAKGVPVTPELIEMMDNKIRSSLMLVGSGTWQGVFNERPRPDVGFIAQSHPEADDVALTARIRAAKSIPDELLARFASDLLFLRYPNSPEEKQELLDSSGISALAGRLGHPINVKELDLHGVGMRRLESLATELLLNLRRQQGFTKLSGP
jgi:hypothetical protein